jgi:ribosomal protein L35
VRGGVTILGVVIRRLSFLIAVFVSLAVVALPSVADAKLRKIKWSRVEVPTSKHSKRVSSRLRHLLRKASKHAKWGKGDPVELRVRVTKLAWENKDDVLRLTLTVIGRIKGGKGARSHIRVGGRPREKRKLEGQALKIVADGLVTRLSALSRR